MAEWSLPEKPAGTTPPAGDNKPAAEQQSCASCGEVRVRAVTMTTRFVYIRCEQCGEVWSIPERRQYPRKDPEKV